MNFDFSDDQKLLRDQIRKLLENDCSLTELRKVFDGKAPYAQKAWQSLAGMGLMGAAIPENYGGAGLGMLELCVVAEELGRALAPVPFSSTIYLATEAIRLAGSEEQKKKWLPQIAAGQAIACFAFAESGQTQTQTQSLSGRNINTSFDGQKLNGEKMPVADAMSANIAVVVAKSANNIVLTLAELESVKRKKINTIDPTREHAQIQFQQTPAQPLNHSHFDDGALLLDHLLDRAAILFAFEQLGGADAALEFARDYANERYAFGRPVGSFQAIKHKLADAYVQNQIARSNCYYAAMVLDNDNPDLPAAAAAARLSAGDAFIYIAQENVQIHGGVGFTWESDCQFFYRRAGLLALTLGGKGRWQERLVSSLEKRNVA